MILYQSIYTTKNPRKEEINNIEMIEVVNDDGTSSGLVPYENIQSTENGIWIVGKMLHDFEGNDEENIPTVKQDQIILIQMSTLEKEEIYIKCLSDNGFAIVPKSYVCVVSNIDKRKRRKVWKRSNTKMQAISRFNSMSSVTSGEL